MGGWPLGQPSDKSYGAALPGGRASEDIRGPAPVDVATAEPERSEQGRIHATFH
jgi:hypothetical protein